MSNAYGNTLKLYIDGNSRDKKLSARLSGFPAGLAIDFEKLRAFTDRRRPGNKPWSTARFEEDFSVFSSGISEGVTTGLPIEFTIQNNNAENTDTTDYARFPRPSHADFPATVKYGQLVDLRGGGHFSGRLTAPYCTAGGLCLQYLEKLNINIYAHIYSIGDVKDIAIDCVNPDTDALAKIRERAFPTVSEKNGQRMQNLIEDIKLDSNSLGGIVECFVTGLPVGLGEHMFRSTEAAICDAVFGIPGVKGIEFGNGFEAARITGIENNDPYRIVNRRVEPVKNSAGGVLGGMTTGAPLVFRVAFKPTPSISRIQQTVDLERMVNAEIKIEGRNDPCYVPRAVPVVEAAAALAVCDLCLSSYSSDDELEFNRTLIDGCDTEIASALHERNTAILKIAAYKKESGSPLYQPEREESVIKHVKSYLDPYEKTYAEIIYGTVLANSRKMQAYHAQPAINGYTQRKFMLIGDRLTHSMSPLVHSLLADYSYELHPLNDEEFENFLQDSGINGFNVTIPYKKRIIPFLPYISEEAKACGAVNTVVREHDGKFKGYNTDISGFIETVKKLELKQIPEKAIIFGKGGAAAAVRHALNRIGVPEVTCVSRKDVDSLSYKNLTEKNFESALIVNCTPCGMFPDEAALPFSVNIIRTAAAVIDLVYNPIRTELLQTAEYYGIPCINGLYMLVYQAAESARLFTGIKISKDKIEEVYSHLLKSSRNIILIGMPGCGKSSVGRFIAEKTGKRFFDTDNDIEERTGYRPGDYINKFGINAFRNEETRSVTTASHLRGAVIATGGGAVLNPENVRRLKSCGTVFLIDRPLEELAVTGRPISEQTDIKELYSERKEIYEAACDRRIESGSIVKQASEIISYTT